MKRMTGYSISAHLTEENFKQMHEAGIDCVEVSPEMREYDSIASEALKNYRIWADKNGILLRSFHLKFIPFEDVDVSALDEDFRLRSVEYTKTWIQLAAEQGIHICVIHASGEPNKDSERTEKMEAAKNSLKTLADFADHFGVTIAVEDLPRTCLGHNSEEILELTNADPRLKVCFDTNHLLIEDPVHFIESCGDRIVATHFSDYDFIDERHWLPGEGKNHWNALMDALDKVGYKGSVNYEMSLSKSVRYLERTRALTYADLVQNHLELENRLPLTVVGGTYSHP